MNETETKERLLELCIDNDHVTITVGRFQELVAAEVKLALVRDVHYKAEYSSEIQSFCRILFGPKPKAEGDDDA